jgi:hypothetical protein
MEILSGVSESGNQHNPFSHAKAVRVSTKYLPAAGAFAVAISGHIVRDLNGRVPSACFAKYCWLPIHENTSSI